MSSPFIFTAQCYAKRGIDVASCLSVRPSVCNVEVSWSYRLVFLENNLLILRLISLTFPLSVDPNFTDLLQRKHPIF